MTSITRLLAFDLSVLVLNTNFQIFDPLIYSMTSIINPMTSINPVEPSEFFLTFGTTASFPYLLSPWFCYFYIIYV